MAKLGGTKHLKRIAAPKAVPVTDRKAKTWMINTAPGPHPKKHAIPLVVLLRDLIGVVTDAREAGRALSRRQILVDGKPRTDAKFPVGLMDVVSFAGKNYRMVVDWKGRLVPLEIAAAHANSKILMVVGKRTVKGGKIFVSFHDGRNMAADNNIKVGDSIIVSLPKVSMVKHLKSETGARCLVSEGKHAGNIVKLKEIIQRKGSKPSEALVESDGGEFITVAKYLVVVDEAFQVKGGKSP
jgi:small subunit ribosomal protein S4e